jgi:hypothetical protein
LKFIEVEYNEDLKPLESVLVGVKRPGDFFVSGALEMPMPKVEIKGSGTLSFPVPEAQIVSIVEQAERAPYGRGEISEAASILDRILRASNAPSKIAWLLEHHYSPAGLSISALKGADAAKAGVLVQAAARAQCAAHVGIVHIGECGAAEPDYDEYSYARRRSRYRDYGDEEGEEDEEEGEDQESAAAASAMASARSRDAGTREICMNSTFFRIIKRQK